MEMKDEMVQDIVGLATTTTAEDLALEYEEFRWAKSLMIRCL